MKRELLSSRRLYVGLAVMIGLVSAQSSSVAQTSLGQLLPGAVGSSEETGSANAPPVEGAAAPSTTPSAADFTDDEKRMQKKYKVNVAHAKALIAKGERMMATGNKEDKDYKKGKIFKEIGQKRLAELEAASPYPQEGADKEKIADKKTLPDSL